MKRKNHISIQFKIIVLIVLVSTINLILASILLYYFEKRDFNREIKEKLNILTNVIGDNNSAAILFNDTRAGTNSLYTLKVDKQIKNAIILFPDSGKFTEYKNTNRPLLERNDLKLSLDTLIFTDSIIIANKPIFFDGDYIATIRLEYSLSDYNQKQYQYLKLLLIILGLSIITTVILATIFQRGITKPILNLYHIINKISFQKDFSIRARIEHNDEIGKLTDGFNFMIEQISVQNNELIKAKVESDAALKTKERFLANMTHELRTPLNSIVGLSNLLAETKLNTEQENYIKNILASSDHLLAIINDLLEFSKLGSGKLQLEKNEFSIRHTIERIESTMGFEAKNRNLRLETRVDNSIPHHVVGDEHRLNQILINLVGNSIKFTPKGSIKIEVKKLSETPDTIDIEFSVKDTGIGIVKEKQSFIFDSFTQESNETTRKYGGTGLGLAITKQLVEIQNGKIWVESEKFEGSTFIFILPYEKKQIFIKKTENEIDIDALYDKKILIVDDNPMNLLFTKSLLDKHGLIAETCENGNNSIKLINKNDYDLILMDLHMPEMDGYETSKQIRLMENPDKKDIPIIALTAAATHNEIKRCSESGMNDYLVKPFKKEELFTKLLSLLLNKPQEKND